MKYFRGQRGCTDGGGLPKAFIRSVANVPGKGGGGAKSVSEGQWRSGFPEDLGDFPTVGWGGKAMDFIRPRRSEEKNTMEASGTNKSPYLRVKGVRLALGIQYVVKGREL